MCIRDRLCLFNSGRWDNDYLTGSFANPFSSEWETRWNDEGNPRGCDFDHRSEKDLAEAPPLLGDVHIYPRVPDRRQNAVSYTHLDVYKRQV